MLVPYLLSTLAIGAVASPLAAISQRQSSVPYGQVIYACADTNHVALTFDDGPAGFTAELLTTLKNAGVKATFFLNGANFGSIDDYAPQVKQMITDGHQIGSHTWVVYHYSVRRLQQLTNMFSIVGPMPTWQLWTPLALQLK